MKSEAWPIPEEMVREHNQKLAPEVERDYQALAQALTRRGVEVEAVEEMARGFGAAIPSWGLMTGGTRFGTFPIPGLPRDIYEKIDDAATVHQLTRANPRVSLHIPWDTPSDPAALKRHAKERGLAFDAVNSNTFQDQPGQKHSYKFGSLSHVDSAVRDQAVAHNLEVARIGETLGSRALSIWIGDGANLPGQSSFVKSFVLYIDSLKKIYARLPRNFKMFIEYKPFEPAFYYTVLSDWGSALMAAEEVGDRCEVLVDLGHHLPNTNVEAIVSRLILAEKLGGFHFNDSQYADDDLTAASISPYRLFRVFHEIRNSAAELEQELSPAYLIDQSHNLTDPIEALIQTTLELQLTFIQAELVDLSALWEYQRQNDVTRAEEELKAAFRADVRPLAARLRMKSGGAIDPLALYRASGYRQRKAKERGGKS